MHAAETIEPTSSDKHLKLVESLQKSAYLRSEHCLRAMQMVDRKDFVLPEIPQNVVYKVKLLELSLSFSLSLSAAAEIQLLLLIPRTCSAVPFQSTSVCKHLQAVILHTSLQTRVSMFSHIIIAGHTTAQ